MARADHASRAQRVAFMIALVVAGEAIFSLPFHLARFFRPTFLDVFDFSKTELGAVQAAYGVVAMLAYFPGGPLADRFSARGLMCVSLLSTAAGGAYLSTLPGFHAARLVWAFFGLTTILTFWAAMIRATRRWGGSGSQGTAYGLLDGGRGLVAALLASAFVRLLAWQLPADAASADPAARADAFRAVILGYTAVTAGAALLVWFAVPPADPRAESADDARRADGDSHADRPARDDAGSARERLRTVLRLPVVWLQAAVIVCAYVGYKGFDNYSLYASEVWGLDEVDAAGIATLGVWMRPIGALGAGWLGDRFRASRVIVVLFAVLLASHLVFALLVPPPAALWILIGNLLAASLAIYGFRGLYFALFEEGRVPMAVTGTAVGLVSVLGYTPDIFVNWVSGVLLDRTPGAAGHRHVFLFLAAFAAAGLLASLAFARAARRRREAAAG